MYICTDCKKKFFNPAYATETHGLSSPPYEKFIICPFCKGENVKYIKVRHCRCCGARLREENRGNYCNDSCKRRGEKLWKLQLERQKKKIMSPISEILKRLEEYNKANNTLYSYGQYVAFVLDREKKRGHRAKA